MTELEKIIRKHRQQYPCLQPQDLYKLIYQNEFGPGHFLKEEKSSLQRMTKEYSEILLQHEGNPIEPVGNGMCRYYLWGTKEKELKMLNRIFVLTANRHRGTAGAFESKLLSVCNLLPELDLGFSEKEYISYINRQKEQNYPAVSHSEEYRNAFLPAYRVIDERFAPYLALFTEIADKAAENPVLVIGIDGNAAAGKTTLAQCLTELFDCDCIHMDDFFLPVSLRTKERLEEIGGNVHYERFLAEVAKGLQGKEAFTYRIFSCRKMDYTGNVKISNQKMIVVEGAYSMRKEFQALYDYKIFMKLDEKEQERRIIKRNGTEMWQTFREKWIPMENRYFQTLGTEEIFDWICPPNVVEL